MVTNYLQILQKAFPGLHDLELELKCAGDAELRKRFKTTATHHRLAAMRMMFPHRVEHEWRVQMVQSWEDARKAKKREIAWIGSAMSNKTGTMGDLLLTLVWENPTNTTILIGSPFKDATEGRLWAEIVKSFLLAKHRHPYLPGDIKKSAGKIEVSEFNIRSGIEMVTIDDHGKLIGGNNDDVTGGNFVLAVDEAPNLPNGGQEVLSAVGNMKMRPSFTFLCAGNFAETSDCLGIVAEPDHPNGYESLDVDADHVWDTPREGRVYRFDGMRSPNVLAQEDIYPFLTRWAVVKNYIDTNRTDSAEFYRWVRSFPILGQDSKTILSMPAIRAGRALEVPQFTSEKLTRGAACDPGFGGDPCMLREFTFGWEIVNGKRMQVLDFPTPPVEVPLRIKKGTDIDVVNKQIVEFSKTWCEQRSITPNHFAFDGSMRANIVQAFMRLWSPQTHAVDFGGSASKRKMSANSQKTWFDEAANFVTEMWLAFGLLVEAGQCRGLQFDDAAVRQFCSRKWSWQGKRKKIETKDEFKPRNNNQSPNEADTCVIALEMARKLGFILRGVIPENGGAVHALRALQQQRELDIVRRSLLGSSLPPGRLRSTEAPSASSNGRLRSYS